MERAVDLAAIMEGSAVPEQPTGQFAEQEYWCGRAASSSSQSTRVCWDMRFCLRALVFTYPLLVQVHLGLSDPSTVSSTAHVRRHSGSLAQLRPLQ